MQIRNNIWKWCLIILNIIITGHGHVNGGFMG